MSTKNIIITGATLINGMGTKPIENSVVVICDGKIVDIGTTNTLTPPTDSIVIQVDGKFLLPGLIDVHVHIREPGHRYKGDWSTETRAALAGGITMICAMPNTYPAITNANMYEHVDSIASSSSYCDYGIYMFMNYHNSAIKVDGVQYIMIYIVLIAYLEPHRTILLQ